MEYSEVKKVLTFNIWSDYAQFRKYFTNMSPLTFAIPPRTVISGIIGTIAGIDKKDNPEKFSKHNSFIALKILNPIRKVKLPTNYLKTTSRKHFSHYADHKPTIVEYLKNPYYRVYFDHTDKNLYDKVKNNLKEHKTVYTTNLGISSCLSNFKYLGEFDVVNKVNEWIDLSSVIDKDIINEITFTENVKIQQCILPAIMQNNREVTEYKEYLYEVEGNNIKASVKNYHSIIELGENIIGM
ncbi:MAG: type I-B CRISPR-associated protein Cas5b [Victivallales bacterium]|nr:type I-B CRISPR-associated protein Cas5b [Victivallales bacterium]MCF7888738.1 type I-B CRISPR-associated protein Cas5b [Victivallales bacterium]